jgi:SAM-dependent methyltransferase
MLLSIVGQNPIVALHHTMNVLRNLTVAFLAASSIGWSQPPPLRKPDVHFTPARQYVADAMLRLARVTRDDVVYDLGSGDGRIPILAAQKYGARAVGIELDPQLIALSREVAREGEVSDRVTFIAGDLFTADLSPATVVTLYLSPWMNNRLESKLREELRPGARVVSLQFPVGNWRPDEKIRVDTQDVFLWTVRK